MNTTVQNTLDWFEISVRDIQKAAAFYATVIGRPLDLSVVGGTPHAVFGASEHGVHGALIQDPKRPPAAGGTVIYLAVHDSVASAVERAREAGGTIVQPVTDLGPHGICALISDRDGNVVGLHAEKA